MFLINSGLSALKNSRFIYKLRPIKQRSKSKKLHEIERLIGRKLDAKTKKMADDYAVAKLGTVKFSQASQALYIYSLVHGSFKEGWLTEPYFRNYMVAQNGAGLEALSRIKTFSRVVLPTEALPDIAYHIDGLFYGANYRRIRFENFVDLCAPHGHIFAKSDKSANGLQIFRLDASRLSADAFEKIGNCVIQYPIKQHPFFEEMFPDAVATLRIITGRKLDGDISALASYLRLGRTPDWKPWTFHPDSHFDFGGKHIPKFADAIEFCLGLHRKMPHFLLIGWDITLDEAGELKLIEWNADHCSLLFSEAVSGPCFEEIKWRVSRSDHEEKCKHIL